jgi:DNA-binding MarR family transcriptional regulator
MTGKQDHEGCIIPDMNASELFLLGRRLMKLGEAAIPDAGRPGVNTTIRLVIADVTDHPDSSVSEITERTGFPQSLVSLSVARLREFGAVVTKPDPADRRRTLVRPAEGAVARGARHGAVPVDETIARALGAQAQERLPEALAALELLGQLITPESYRLVCEPADTTES